MFESGSTVTLATTNDSIYLRGNAKLYGMLNLSHIGDGGTGISVFNNDYAIEFIDTSRVTFDNYFVAIGSWNGAERVTVTLPVGAQKKEQDGATYWHIGDDNIVSFISVSNITFNVTSPL